VIFTDCHNPLKIRSRFSGIFTLPHRRHAAFAHGNVQKSAFSLIPNGLLIYKMILGAENLRGRDFYTLPQANAAFKIKMI
jgi:hypothetical protein